MDSYINKIKEMFIKMGASPEQALIMSSQLIKRANQISKEKNISHEEAIKNLLCKIIDVNS